MPILLNFQNLEPLQILNLAVRVCGVQQADAQMFKSILAPKRGLQTHRLPVAPPIKGQFPQAREERALQRLHERVVGLAAKAAASCTI